MAKSKVTFALDETTVGRLQDAAARLAKPKSAIVREAILDYYDRLGRLSESERIRMLRVSDEYVPAIPCRSAASVDGELAGLREARKAGGRRAGGQARP